MLLIPLTFLIDGIQLPTSFAAMRLVIFESVGFAKADVHGHTK